VRSLRTQARVPAAQRRHVLPDWARRRALLQAPQANKNILPANAEDDGLAYDGEGHVYVDNAVTDAAASAGPFQVAAAKRVGLCHFPTTARDPWQARRGPAPASPGCPKLASQARACPSPASKPLARRLCAAARVLHGICLSPSVSQSVQHALPCKLGLVQVPDCFRGGLRTVHVLRGAHVEEDRAIVWHAGRWGASECVGAGAGALHHGAAAAGGRAGKVRRLPGAVQGRHALRLRLPAVQPLLRLLNAGCAARRRAGKRRALPLGRAARAALSLTLCANTQLKDQNVA